MKYIYVITAFLLVSSCSSESIKSDNEFLPPIEVSKVVTENGKTFLEVDGIPFPLLGAQIRLDALLNCDKYPIEKVEDYFIKANELGVNCVQIPLWWKLYEPQEDQFDFSIVDQILGYAVKYNLKLEVLLFNTNMCGDSFSFLVPQYVLSKPDKKLRRDDEATFRGLYGYIYSLVLNDTWLLQRECNAVTKLFDHIRYWDKENGETHPVITAQIHNEPDGMTRWRIDQYNIKAKDGSILTKDEGWEMITDALDRVGQAVKSSSYKVATRVNITSVDGTGIKGFLQHPAANPIDVFNLKGIDFVSFDPYHSEIQYLKKELLSYKSIQGNYPLVAENRGIYENTPSLILASLALGGGYDIYDLATSKFIHDISSPPFNEEGIYKYDLSERSHTTPTKMILKGLKDASSMVGSTPTEDFAAFNIVDDYPREQISQQIKTTGANISFETNQGAIGFALDRGNFLLIYTTKDAVMQLSNGKIDEIVTGKYNMKGEFIVENSNILLENNSRIYVQGGHLYKVSFLSSGLLESNVIQNIGSL